MKPLRFPVIPAKLCGNSQPMCAETLDTNWTESKED
jgi:hypothetical protein